MAGELGYPFGMPVTLQFTKANVVENAATALTLAQGGGGLKLPTGYKFHPMFLFAEANAALNAGTAVFKVTKGGTALANGPVVTLDANTQVSTAVAAVGVDPIAANTVIGVTMTADVNYAPNTLDIDAVLVGVILPA
jgi:hypothetical protein